MNNRIIFLAETIQNKIKQLQSTAFTAIDKDILLEDVREFYRLLQQVEVKSSVSTLQSNVEIESNIVKQQTISTKDVLEDEQAITTSESNMNKTECELHEKEENSLEKLVASLQKELEEVKRNEREIIEAKVSEVHEQTVTLQVEHVIEEEKSNLDIKEDKPDFLSTSVEESQTFITGSSLNDSFSVNQATSLNQKSVSEPVKELHNLISSTSVFSSVVDFNNRILFTQELFNGDSQMCSTFLEQIESCKTLEEAKTIVNTHALTKGWKGDNDAVKSLVKLVRQFYS